MHDLDCHIIIHKEPQWKVDRCLASLEDQPVNLYFVEGVEERPVYQGRAKGFAMGSASYVTCVDPDDWVEPGAVEKLMPYIGNHDLVHGWERVVREGKPIGVNRLPHHLYILKRGLDIDYSGQHRSLRDVASRFVVPEILYNWDITGGIYGR